MTNQIRFGAFLDDHVSSSLGKIRDQFNLIGGKGTAASLFGNIGAKAAGVALGLVGQAASSAADFIGTSINAARDLTETLSKSTVVFGASAKDIEAWGNGSARSMGLSKQAAIEAAASFGNLFTGLDMTQPKAAAMSESVVQLAGDLASFNNIDPNEALDKLRAGLAGESEPLRRVGVFLTEAKVRAKAMEMGLVDAHGELSEGSKVLARYQIILDETATAQGDFARTSENLANKQRTASATIINKQAELGATFEKSALQVTEWQLDFLYGIDVVAKGMNDFQNGTNDFRREVSDNLLGTALVAQEAAKEHEAAFGDSADAADSFEKRLAEAGRKVQASSAATADAIANAQGRARFAWETTRAKTVAAANDMISKAFEPLIAKDNLLAANAEIAAARRVLASSSASKAEKADARSTILKTTEAAAGYLVTLAETGDTTSKAYKDGIKSLKKSIAASSGPAKKALEEVLAWILKVEAAGKTVPVNVVFASSVSDGGPARRAAGGPIKAGEVYQVGEKGPEWFVSDDAGTIYPNGTPPGGHMSLGSSIGGASGGGGVSVNFYSTFAPSPADGQRLAQMIVPAVTREMQRQRV